MMSCLFGSLSGGIPDLIKALSAVGLTHKAEEAEAWCQEQGAELLEEVIEFFDDFASGIGLPN